MKASRRPQGRRKRATHILADMGADVIKIEHPVRGDDTTYLGSESDWAQAPRRLVCGRRNGHYFAKVLSSQRDKEP